jgi:hypothetical protein
MCIGEWLRKLLFYATKVIKLRGVYFFMTDNYQKISPTAIACATLRADYTDIPYAREIMNNLKLVGVKPYLPKWLQNLVYFLPGMRQRFSGQEIRYESTNLALKKIKPSVVLEISAGFSTRGISTSKGYESYIETDLSEIINLKEEIVNKLNKPRSNLLFAHLNPLNYSELKQIGKKIIKNKKQGRIALIHEGLITYFNNKEQRTMMENIQRFFRDYFPNGVYITPDFSFREKKHGILSYILKLVQRKTDRDYNFFKNDDEVKRFLEKNKLEGRALDNSSVLVNLSCLAKLKVNASSLKEVAKDYRPWIITLKK